ncbi:MAG: hypothetical protein BGO31_10995 [Bacteroidetes bacterium 43-16]|uniref:hypothetical protein n=1 Tax=uncultured Dysgonomonas sp. TaxID=206096 RepID=UPI00092786A3|nr:hypothetical protein [uncultured Dysgonomonas sp.]OJV50986.1 MAG: hypothetical protein BGO31_10995 [Bacteroidetes bacterium 43-16]
MKKELTILSFGAGQDSTTILYKIVLDKAFRERYVKGKLLVLMSNTGNEHPHTYAHVDFIAEFCLLHGIEFYLIDHSMGYHPRNWSTLQDNFRIYDTVMSVAFPKVCTDNLKIKPLYGFLDHYIAKKYFGYVLAQPPKGKKYIKQFRKKHGTIQVLIGIAAGEENRIAKSNNRLRKAMQLDLFKKVRIPRLTWMDNCITKIYPLTELKMNRHACQQYILAVGLPLPFPFNCLMCPFASKIEILWLYRKYLPSLRNGLATSVQSLENLLAQKEILESRAN